MCSLTDHVQTLMKTVTQQPFQNKQALKRGLHNCSLECKGSGLHSVHHRGPAFSCYATQECVFLSAPLPSSCLQFCQKEKYRGTETLWSKYPSEYRPQSSSLSSLSFHRVPVTPLHLLLLKARHGEGKAAPKEPPCPQCQFTNITQKSMTNFSPRPESDQLADVGNERRGLPKQKTPVASNSPPLPRTKTHCGAGDSAAAQCENKSSIKVHSKQIQALYMLLSSHSAPRTGCSPPGDGKRP